LSCDALPNYKNFIYLRSSYLYVKITPEMNRDSELEMGLEKKKIERGKYW